MKKYFKFMKFRESFKSFIIIIIANIVGQCYAEWSISHMIKLDIIIALVWIFATLVVDWVQIKSKNSKDRNSKE